jgi:hypothetical protein
MTIFFNSINSSDVRIKSFVCGTPRFEKILQSRVSFPIGHRKTILWYPCHGRSSVYFLRIRWIFCVSISELF